MNKIKLRWFDSANICLLIFSIIIIYFSFAVAAVDYQVAIVLLVSTAVLAAFISVFIGMAKKEMRSGERIVKIEKTVIKTRVVTKSKVMPILQIIVVSGLMALIFSVYFYWIANTPKPDANPGEVIRLTNLRELGLLLMILLGSMGFGAPFLFLGYVLADPFQRAKVKRSVFKKNYGIVNFVSKGGKILSKIKDFDTDLIWVKDGVWSLESNRVFKQIKSDDPSGIEESYPIMEKHIQNIVGIPVLFLDMDTMRPLTFERHVGDVNPTDLGSTLKGWVMNQLAKNMFFKQTFTILMIIAIAAAGISAYFGYLNYTNTQKMLNDMMPKIDEMMKYIEMSQQVGQQIIQQGGG